MSERATARIRRHRRVRKSLSGTAARPRLSVFRSLGHVYAQVIDDSAGQTLTSASTLEPEVRGQAQGKTKTEQAGLVGTLVAKRALGRGVAQVAFDRGGFLYHGRIKALADAARQAGLKF